MATRSRIAIELADGTVLSIYCHWDGYPEHNGKILLENYSTDASVVSLIKLGNISFLGKSTDCPDGHSFETPVQGYTVAYHRDRGEDLVPARIHESVEDFFNSDIEAYGYCWTDGKWLVKEGYTGNPPQELKTVLEQLAHD